MMKNFVFGLMVFGCVAGGMSDNVEGMNEDSASMKMKKMDPYSYAPIGIDFPCFLGYCDKHRDNWPSALRNIRENLEWLQDEESCSDLKFAYDTVRRISDLYAFNEMVLFCKTSACDMFCKETLRMLFSIMPKVIRSLPSRSCDPNNENVASEIESFVGRLSVNSQDPFLREEDTNLFNKVSELKWQNTY